MKLRMSRFGVNNISMEIKTYNTTFLSSCDKFSPILQEFISDDSIKTLCPYNIILCYIDISGSTFNTGGRHERFSREYMLDNSETKIICIAEMECIAHLFVNMANKFIFDNNMDVRVYTFSDEIYNGAILNNVTSRSLYDFAKTFPMKLIYNSSATATNLVFDNITQILCSEHRPLCVLATDGQPNDKQLTLKSVENLVNKINVLLSGKCTMMIIGSGSISSETVCPFTRISQNGIKMDVSIVPYHDNLNQNIDENINENTRKYNSMYSECDIDYIRSLLDFFPSDNGYSNIYVGAYGDYSDAIKAFSDFFTISPIIWKAHLPHARDNNPIICNISYSKQIEKCYVKKIISIADVSPYGHYLIMPIKNQFGYNIFQLAITLANDVSDDIIIEINDIKNNNNIRDILNIDFEYPIVIWHNANIYDGCICNTKFYILCCEKKIKININDNDLFAISDNNILDDNVQYIEREMIMNNNEMDKIEDQYELFYYIYVTSMTIDNKLRVRKLQK